MKRKHGEYSLGRSSGQYTPNNPFWFKRNNPYHNMGSATVADTVGNTFQPRYLPQQTPSQYSAGPIYPPSQIIDDQSYVNSSPQSAVQKIQELKTLMNKYPKYHTNPDDIIRWAIYNSINGDNTLLDDKLEQLRSIDSLAKYYAS